jgi:hypothetical protein
VEMVKPSDLAKLWGLSTRRVQQYHKEGMPLESVEAATRWRAERYGGSACKILELSAQVKGGVIPTPPKAPNAEDLERVDVYGVHARLIESERQAWQLYAGAVAELDASLIRVQAKLYADTVKIRVAAEKDILAIMRERGDLVPGGTAAEMVARVLEAVRVLLLSMPHRLASRVNPEDPDMARGVLAAEIASTMERMRALVDGMQVDAKAPAS